jgi:hypothetical protein
MVNRKGRKHTEEWKKNISTGAIGKGKRNPILIGQRFGRLVVTGHPVRSKSRGGEGKDYYYYVDCVCDCGKGITTMEGSLRHGNVRSCGCLRKESIPRLPSGEAMRNVLYKNYVARARKKMISFELTILEFQKITSSNCHYCGKEPSQMFNNKCSTGKYVYNGIDRKDSNKGYTADNSLPCCWVCNDMKKANSYEDFISHILAIASNVGVRVYSRRV